MLAQTICHIPSLTHRLVIRELGFWVQLLLCQVSIKNLLLLLQLLRQNKVRQPATMAFGITQIWHTNIEQKLECFPSWSLQVGSCLATNCHSQLSAG